MTESEFNLCRPDAKHFCIECCSLTSCCHLGRLRDKTYGCLAHDGKNPENNLPRRSLCNNFKCWNVLTEEDVEKMVEYIKGLSKGEFHVSTVAERLGLLDKLEMRLCL